MSQVKTSLPSLRKKLFFIALAFLLMCLLLEVFSSLSLIYLYRQRKILDQIEPSFFSSVNLLHKVAVKAGLRETLASKHSGGYEFDKSTTPKPFTIPDSLLGYSAPAGTYVHSYLKRQIPNGDWQTFKTRVTMNDDGSRWTGNFTDDKRSEIYLFGDSYVFGSGVNDEQTFSYLLQQAHPEKKVKLFALGGYSLAHSYLRFKSIQGSIGPEDTIILGYADFYDCRNVKDPAHLRGVFNWISKQSPKQVNLKRTVPRARLKPDQSVAIDYIEENCLHNNGLCEEPGISQEEQTKTSAALVNNIARNTGARVILLHFDGKKDNPVRNLLDAKIELLSALPEDFDYFISDGIEGFDPHPGPYWHYAISRKLIDYLQRSKNEKTDPVMPLQDK